MCKSQIKIMKIFFLLLTFLLASQAVEFPENFIINTKKGEFFNLSGVIIGNTTRCQLGDLNCLETEFFSLGDIMNSTRSLKKHSKILNKVLSEQMNPKGQIYLDFDSEKVISVI